MTHAKVTIDGVELNAAQVMVLRLALERLLNDWDRYTPGASRGMHYREGKRALALLTGDGDGRQDGA